MVQNRSLFSFYLTVKIILIITIVSVFAIQASFNVISYLKRRMYFLITNDFASPIHLPDITICPTEPWDPRKLEKYGMKDAETSHFSHLSEAYIKLWLQSKELKAKEVWENGGWSLGAVVEKFAFGDLQEEYDRTETTSKHWFQSMTPMGPCHTLRLPPMSPEKANHTLHVYPRFGPKAKPCTWEWHGHLNSYQNSEDCFKVLAFCNTSCGWEGYLRRMRESSSYVIALTGEHGVYSAPYPTVYLSQVHGYDRLLSLLAEATETKVDSRGCTDLEARHRCLVNELEAESASNLGCIPYAVELVENHTLGEICSVNIGTLFTLIDKETTRCPDLCQFRDWKYRQGPYTYQDFFKIEFKVSVPYTLRKTEKELYPINMLLSDTGGSLGFFLGVSLFSLVEWFITCLQKYWTRKYNLAREKFNDEWYRERNSHGVRIKSADVTPGGYGSKRVMEHKLHLKKENVTHVKPCGEGVLLRRPEEHDQNPVEVSEEGTLGCCFYTDENLRDSHRHILRLVWLVGRVLLGFSVATHSLVAVYTSFVEPIQHSVSQFSIESSLQGNNSEVDRMIVERLASRTFHCYDAPTHDEDRCLLSCLLFMSVKELPSLTPFYFVDDLPSCDSWKFHLPLYRYIAPQYMYEVLLQKYKRHVCRSICSSLFSESTLTTKNYNRKSFSNKGTAAYRAWIPQHSSSLSLMQSIEVNPTIKQVPSVRNLTRYFPWKRHTEDRANMTAVPTGYSEGHLLYEQGIVDEVDDSEHLLKITKVANLLCEIGGIAGLYMGISILTLLSAIQKSWRNLSLKSNKDTRSSRSSITSRIPTAIFKTMIALLGAFLVLCKGFSFLLDHPVTTQISENKTRLDGYMPAVTLCYWPPLSLERLSLALNLSDFPLKEDDFLTQVKNMSLALNSTVGQRPVSEFFEKENAMDVFWTFEEMMIIYNLIDKNVEYFFPSDPDPRWTPTVSPFGRCFTFRTNGTEKGLRRFQMALRYHIPITHSYVTIHSPTEEPLLMGLSDTLGSYPLIKMEEFVGMEGIALSPARHISFKGQDRLPYSTCVSSCVHVGVRDAMGCALPHVLEAGKKEEGAVLSFPEEGGSPGADDVPPCTVAKYLEYLELLATWRSTEEQLVRNPEGALGTEELGTSFTWIPEKDPATMTEEEIFEEQRRRSLREQLEASPMSERRHLDGCKQKCQAKSRMSHVFFYRHDSENPFFDLKLPSAPTLTQLEDLDNAPLAKLVSDVGGVAGLTVGASILSVVWALLTRCSFSRCPSYRSSSLV